MSFRIGLAKGMKRLGRFIEESAIMVLRPEDLIEFGKQTYAGQSAVQDFSSEQCMKRGLEPLELELLTHVPSRSGRLLLLGVGGGREAIPLAKMGYKVTGLDYIPAMIEKAKERARQDGVAIEGWLVQDISRLDLSDNAFDICWLSAYMYSSIPTANKRIAMLKRINNALTEKGYFAFQFLWGSSGSFNPKAELARKAIACLTFGNHSYEKGDRLFTKEFLHAFQSVDELRSEFQKAGFDVTHLHIPESTSAGGAVLRKV